MVKNSNNINYFKVEFKENIYVKYETILTLESQEFFLCAFSCFAIVMFKNFLMHFYYSPKTPKSTFDTKKYHSLHRLFSTLNENQQRFKIQFIKVKLSDNFLHQCNWSTFFINYYTVFFGSLNYNDGIFSSFDSLANIIADTVLVIALAVTASLG